VEEGGDGRREAPVSRVSAATAQDARGEAAEEGGGATKHLNGNARQRERERERWTCERIGPEREEEKNAWVSLGPVHRPIGLAQREFAH